MAVTYRVTQPRGRGMVSRSRGSNGA